jgi:6-phosphofructokinase 1
MNTAARAAVRLGIDAGLQMLGVYGSFKGLLDGEVWPLSWGDVEGWVGDGGAELGTRRDSAGGGAALRDRPQPSRSRTSTRC